MRIYFTRHGESQANILHELSNRGLRHGLTRTGRAQALALAQRLQDSSITRIYSSPVLRAIETSIIVANQLAVEYEVVEALREYDCGEIEGRTDEAAWKVWQEQFDAWVVHRRYEQCIPGGETFYDIWDRFVPFVDGLVQRCQDSAANLLCVGHGGLYWMMLPEILINVDHNWIAQHRFAYTTCIVCEPRRAGLVCLEWNGIALAE